MPDWRGERLSLERAAGAANLQMHLVRHVWAFKYVEGRTHCDAGCGTGYGTWLLAQVTAQSVGLDPCAQAIAEAARRYREANLRFVCAQLEDMAGCAGGYGAVTAFESLEHVEDLDGCLRIIAEDLLEADGVFLGSIPLCAGANPYHYGRDYNATQWAEVLGARFALQRLYYQPIGYQVEAAPSNTDIWPIEDAAQVGDRTDGNLLFVATQKE